MISLVTKAKLDFPIPDDDKSKLMNYVFPTEQYRLTLAMGFTVISTPQIPIASRKCGQRTGVDGTTLETLIVV